MNSTEAGSLMTVVCFLISIVITLLMTPIIRKIGFNYGLLDHPNSRKQHNKPIARVGGIAIIIGILISSISTYNFFNLSSFSLNEIKIFWAITLGMSAFFILGLADDFWSLEPIPRLVLQISIAGVMWNYGVRIDNIKMDWLGLGIDNLLLTSLTSFILTSIWIVGATNAINWFDGLDGLAAGVSGISALSLIAIGLSNGQICSSVLAAALAGASIGFLNLNLYPAKILMGDGGSYLIGSSLASISILSSTTQPYGLNPLLPLLILLLPLCDMTRVIITRLSNGDSPFLPDRNHLHHKLLTIGFSERSTVHLIYSITLLLSAIALSLIFDDVLFLLLISSLTFIITLFYELRVRAKL